MVYEFQTQHDAWKTSDPRDDERTKPVVLTKMIEVTCEVEVPVDEAGGFEVDDVWELWDEELAEREEVWRDYE